jgi:hypothetical protein
VQVLPSQVRLFSDHMTFSPPASILAHPNPRGGSKGTAEVESRILLAPRGGHASMITRIVNKKGPVQGTVQLP